MSKNREPIDLIVAKGKKHLTKSEIEERRSHEISPCLDDTKPPEYLSSAQKKRFEKLCNQLLKIKIMGETDTEVLARYVVAEELYERSTKRLMTLTKSFEDMDEIESVAKFQDRCFKQAQNSASALGLTISSRCRLQIPVKEEEKHINKFSKFNAEA